VTDDGKQLILHNSPLVRLIPDTRVSVLQFPSSCHTNK